MKTLVIRNADNSARVEFKVDIIGSNQNFTVMQVSDLDDAEVVFGINFRELATNLQAFTSFCTANNLILDNIDIDPAVGSTEVVAEGVAMDITDSDPLAGGTDGAPYSETLTVVGGSGDKTWEVSVGSLPSQLTLNASTGAIAGTPDTVENPTFTVKATDALGQAVTQQLSIDIT